MCSLRFVLLSGTFGFLPCGSLPDRTVLEPLQGRESKQQGRKDEA